jgi:hypothetical protein
MHTVAGVEEEEEEAEEAAITITLVEEEAVEGEEVLTTVEEDLTNSHTTLVICPKGIPCEEGVCRRKVMDIIHRIWQPR